jgi:hypothetical protein
MQESLMEVADEYPWSANTRKLRIWFRAVLILSAIWIIALFLPLPDTVMSITFSCLPISIIASIGCVVYAYRVQGTLHQLGLSARQPSVIAVGAFVIGPLLTAIIASMSIASSLKRITQGLQDGSLAIPAAAMKH